MAEQDPKKIIVPRRSFLKGIVRGASVLAVAGATGTLAAVHSTKERRTVWQIDPWKCTYCGLCATSCVLTPSAVKCVQDFNLCGYCDFCFGFFKPNPESFETGAENQLCPMGAIRRKFIEEPYYEYTIDESLCVGCALCVKGCTKFGNGSFYLQVRHDRCLNCNECAIAVACPAGAFIRRPADEPYIIKHKGRTQL
jgi:electron transport complex protein RnfB